MHDSPDHDAAGSPPWFDPAVLAASCGGLGRIPFAPGTFGAAAGVIVSLAVAAAQFPPVAEAAVPAAARSTLPEAAALLLAAFLLHRVFDIAKPFPCRQLEHLPAGLGIMADDWGAALWMAVILTVCRWSGWV